MADAPHPGRLADLDQLVAGVNERLASLVGVASREVARHGGTERAVACLARSTQLLIPPADLAALLALAVIRLAEHQESTQV